MVQRKRTRSRLEVPADSINPFSRSQRQLSQFSLAGLVETDQDPAAADHLFPHRAFGSHTPSAGDTEDSEDEAHGEDVESVEGEENEENQEDGSRKPRPRGPSQMDRYIQTLVESIYHFLDAGDVAKAAQSYGAILQLRPGGRPIDVRRDNLWAIGAEILMRQVDAVPSIDEVTPASLVSSHQEPRWGHAGNMGKVKAYFETLIQQYPYDHRRPNDVSARDFWAASLHCELYNIQAEQQIALHSLHTKLSANDQSITGSNVAISSPRVHREQAAAAQKKVQARACLSARDINRRVKHLMQDPPYSNNAQFQQLLAAVTSYLLALESELSVPAEYPAKEL